MFNIFNKKDSSKEIVKEYLKKDDYKSLMFIFLSFSMIIILSIYLLQLPLTLHILSIINLIIALVFYIKLSLFKKIENSFKKLFPLHNNENEYLFELIFALAETEKINEKYFVQFVNNKYKEMQKYYIEK